ncbi:MAG TPA: TIGR01244 family phosphatase, partial [Hellea balneolensis]|nr:TIGR01244 family phosphatase [Hellea balneolensis]
MLNKFNKITDDFYATMQIFPEQIDFIKESGFKSIIINRPDMEKPGQPFAEDM